MTGWGVEREPRPARRPSAVSSTGPALMPPHSQGAERQRGNRSGSRWGLRALVVGGIAGAAWLLSGAAAHAAEHEPVTGGLLGAATQAATHAVGYEGVGLEGAAKHASGLQRAAGQHRGTGSGHDHAAGHGRDGGGTSLLGAVVHGAEADAPVIGRVLGTVAEPWESGGRHTGLGTVTTIPKRLVDTVGEVTHSTDADSALGGVDRVIRDLTAPVRLTGEAVDTRTLVPVTDVVTGLPQHAAEPDAAAPQNAPEPDAGATTPDVAFLEQPRATDEHKSAPVLTQDLVRHPVGKTVTRHQVAHAAFVPETVREKPDGDGPAPLRVDLGAANGFPASGAGTATDGGPSAAVLPSAVADSSTACRRLPIATDVEVRRHDAEAPTVSPD
ncbi:hypothetical protein AB0J80_26240 [Actinoplanes sp. NPDC049548]|uniref:hypothetical protein n=1 Tax=Actinoplanes sp. NPDC049548 TaxID=3155152 RepID=UPI00341C2E0A